MKTTALTLLLLVCLVARTAQAACTSPAGKEADMIYNQAYHTFQFCNGTSWIPMCFNCATGGGSDTAFVTSESLGSLRNDFTGGVGFRVTIGASNITVTQLGRWVVSGNSQNHTLLIYDNSCTILTSVSINTSGATPGAFLYGTLSPSITLSAGATYYILSDETSGGDQWYQNTTTLGTTTAGTIVTSGYNDGTCNGASGGDPSHSYGPVDFKYH